MPVEMETFDLADFMTQKCEKWNEKIYPNGHVKKKEKKWIFSNFRGAGGTPKHWNFLTFIF